MVAALLGAASLIMPAISYGQGGELTEETSADETRCDELRVRATALHQERDGMSDTEDFLALAVGMETLDVALNEVAREYVRLSCGRPSNDSIINE